MHIHAVVELIEVECTYMLLLELNNRIVSDSLRGKCLK